MVQIEAADIVVVGAGMAGLAAAHAATERGARVCIVEKAERPGGSFAISGGFIWTVPTFELYREIVPNGDPALGRLLVDSFAESIDWLRSRGARFGPHQTGLFTREIGQGYRLEPDPLSAGVEPLVQGLEAAGGVIHCDARANRLLVDDDSGAVVGLRVAGSNGVRSIRCRAVVLATGGFQGDSELVTRYMGRWGDRLFLRANPTSTGDGLRLALAAGAAASRGLHGFYGHLLPAPPARIEQPQFRPLSQYYSRDTVALNLHGERFTDESLGDELTNQALARQPEARGFLVFDDAAYREHILKPHMPDGPIIDPLELVPAVGGVVIKAATLAEIADRLGDLRVPAGSALATLTAYDRAMTADTPQSLPVPRRFRRYRLHRPPFYAVPVQPGLTFTHGGVRIDTACRALDRDGRAIDGLYAAGIDAGGIFFEGYVGGLAASLVTGRRAGTSATATA